MWSFVGPHHPSDTLDLSSLGPRATAVESLSGNPFSEPKSLRVRGVDTVLLMRSTGIPETFLPETKVPTFV